MILPDIQKRLHAIAEELLFPLLFPRTLEDVSRELHHLSREISRRKAVRRAPPRSRRTTRELSRAMRDTATSHPEMSEQDIAHQYGVTAGRVSEALNGKRR